DGRVLVFAVAVTVVTGLVSGMAPAWSVSRVDVGGILKRTGGVAGRASGNGIRNALVIMDVALAFALIVATGLLGRSFHNVAALDPGFDPHNVLTLTPAVSPSLRF